MIHDILSLIGSIFTVISFIFDDITDEKIEKNINYLKQEEWFQKYIDNKKYQQLIINNTNVRNMIGIINLKKMNEKKYYKKQQQKIENILRKQLEKT